MIRVVTAVFMMVAVIAALPSPVSAQTASKEPPDPTKSSFGERSTRTPQELSVFSFLIGKFEGAGTIKLADGKLAEFPVTWIGRYILDGTAISDEMHSFGPDGKPYLGITLRQYDTARKTWIIEYLNVTGSFVRKQVNRDAGAVTLNGRNVTIASASPSVTIREHYLVPDNDSFVYRLDVSEDGGKNWIETQMEMTLRRAK
ncbi:MAG TPA: hypothetical protein VFS23_08055 [Vicinamibacterales bacterium]|nr:hypothetical protein [Vicinamibacterales bacterium]